MAWETSRHTLPGDWKTRKARCLAEHERRCHVCGHDGADEVDHVVNVARGGSHEPENLRPIHGHVCPTCGRRCHQSKTATEAQTSRHRGRREPERHPGLLW